MHIHKLFVHLFPLSFFAFDSFGLVAYSYNIVRVSVYALHMEETAASLRHVSKAHESKMHQVKNDWYDGNKWIASQTISKEKWVLCTHPVL